MSRIKNRLFLMLLVLSVFLLSSNSPIEAVAFTDNVAVSSASGDELHPDIALDHAGNLFITWQDWNDATGYDVTYAWSYDSGTTFTSGGVRNKTEFPIEGGATLTNSGGSASTTLAADVLADAEEITLTSTAGIPASGGSGIITTLAAGDGFEFTGVAGSTLTGCSDIDVAHSAGDTVDITWEAGSSPIGNGGITVFYVAPWMVAEPVVCTYSAASDEWSVDGPTSGAATTTEDDGTGPPAENHYYPVVTGTDADGYTIDFVIEKGDTDWGDGDSFSIPIVNQTVAYNQTFPAIAVDDNLISHFVWSDNRVTRWKDGVWSYRRYDVWAADTSGFGGDQWAYVNQVTEDKISFGSNIIDDHSSQAYAPDIAVEVYFGVKYIYAIWPQEDDDGIHIYFEDHIGDGASGWSTRSTVRTRVDDDEDDSDLCPQASLGVIGRDDDEEEQLHVAFYNEFDDTIRYTSSTDGGGSWGTTLTVNDEAGVSDPDIAVSDTDKDGIPEIYVVFSKSGSAQNIYMARLDEGASAFTTPTRINNSTGNVQDSPSITVNPVNGRLYVVWRDEVAGESDIYFSQSFDSGDSWGVDLNDDGDVSDSGEGIDLVVNDDSAFAIQNHPVVEADQYGHVYVVWEDARNASATGYDIYLARLVASVLTGEGQPEAPFALSAVGGNGSVTLTWSASPSPDIVSYTVYRSTTRGTWTGTSFPGILTTSYDDTTVTNGTAYWYVVTATNASAQESDFSNDARATPNSGDTTAPSAPTNLTAVGGTDPLSDSPAVSLSWTASTSGDVAGYHIYRSIVSGKSYSLVVDSFLGDLITATWFLNWEDLSNGVTYYFVVTALDTSNNESADSNEASAVPTAGTGGGTATSPDPAPGGSADVGGPGGGCFIATACYGTPLAEEVVVLSMFRDEYLETNGLGGAFVKAYNKVSPSVATFISKRPLIKFSVRMQLKPWVKFAHLFVEHE